MVPFLYTELSNLIYSILKQIVKKEELVRTTGSKIQLGRNEIFLDAKSVDLGFGTRSALRQCKELTTKEVLLFRKDCKRCLIKFSEVILTRSPLKYKLAKGLTFLDPKIISSPNGVKVQLQNMYRSSSRSYSQPIP